MDFSRDDFGVWQVDPPFRYGTPTAVHVGEPVVHDGLASIEVEIEADGVRSARVRYLLESGRRSLGIEWLLEKEHVVDPESVYVAFPFALGEPRFRLDLNGIPCSPNEHQLNGAVRDWYPVRRWARRERRRARRYRRSARCAARAARRNHDREGRQESSHPEGPV